MPYLHDLVVSLAAPWVVLSPRSGQLTGTGAEGVFAADRRLLSVLRLTVDRYVLQPVHVDEYGAASAGYDAIVEGLGDAGHDATVTVRRTRELGASGRQEAGLGLTETIVLTNRSHSPVECDLIVALGTDLAGTAAVRGEERRPLLLREPEVAHSSVRWTDEDVVVTALLDRRPDATRGPSTGCWRRARGPGRNPGGSTTITIRVDLTARPRAGFRIGPPAARPAYGVEVECDDSRVERWFQRSLDEDAAGLMLSTTGDDRSSAPGRPWYLTLFGRDSLISTVDDDRGHSGPAAGTLRALAGRQGTRVDPRCAEQPGEVRRTNSVRPSRITAPGGAARDVLRHPRRDAAVGRDAATGPGAGGYRPTRWRICCPRSSGAGLAAGLRRHDSSGCSRYIDESGHGLARYGVEEARGTRSSGPTARWPKHR